MSNEETLQENNERLETNNVALAEVLAIINELPDAEANGTSGVLDNFSTEEVKTNQVWIDGRPIYRKVLPTGQLQNNGSVRVKYNIQNLDIFTKVDGIAHFSNFGLLLPTANSTLNKNVNVYIDYVYGEICVETFSDRSMYTKGYLIVEYVKTTDDDVFVPDGGGSLEVYDKTETLVGVWMGKPLYRKVISFTMPTVSTDGTYPSGNSEVVFASNVDFVRLVSAWTISGTTSPIQFQSFPYINNSGKVAKGFVSINENGEGELAVTTNSTAFSEKQGNAIVEYTKSTN